jgi:hypothetical protein
MEGYSDVFLARKTIVCPVSELNLCPFKAPSHGSLNYCGGYTASPKKGLGACLTRPSSVHMFLLLPFPFNSPWGRIFVEKFPIDGSWSGAQVHRSCCGAGKTPQFSSTIPATPGRMEQIRCTNVRRHVGELGCNGARELESPFPHCLRS